ncbi:MAG: hypothetical protein LBG81_05780 [Coriobacteriaceae bacterium]|jgi:hypothetical protein|nr:hypothetical protein [Coriobacteriaceae bacterium]
MEGHTRRPVTRRRPTRRARARHGAEWMRQEAATHVRGFLVLAAVACAAMAFVLALGCAMGLFLGAAPWT